MAAMYAAAEIVESQAHELGAPMKKLLVITLAFVFYTAPGQAQQPASSYPSSAEPASAELMTSTKAWTDAMNAKDHSKVEELVAPEFALYRWNGDLMTQRVDWLDFLYHTEIKEYTVRDVSARAYGDFGVVTSVCTWTGVHNGAAFDVHAVMVDTWRRTNGRWQVVARSSCTPTPASAGTPSPCPAYHYSR
jgi:ketosteroid isomerase-like protein